MRNYSIDTRYLSGDFEVPDEISKNPRDVLTYIYKKLDEGPISSEDPDILNNIISFRNFINNIDINEVFEDSFWAIAEISTPHGYMNSPVCHIDEQQCCASCAEAENCSNVLSLHSGRNLPNGSFWSKSTPEELSKIRHLI